MALSTYAELQASVLDYLVRPEYSTVVVDFIALAESRINKTLRTRFQETSVSFTIDSATEALPSDFLELRTLVISGTPTQVVTVLSPADLETTYSANVAGKPQNFAIIGSNIKFGPAPDTSYSSTLVYYAKIPALSNTNTTNWLLTNYPDLYLYGTLIESAPYMKDDARVQTWMGFYDRAIAGITGADERSKWNGAPLTQRVDVSVGGRSFGFGW